MNLNIDISKRIFNNVYYPYLNYYNKRLLILFGGSSSGKSKFVAQRTIYQLLKGGRNFLCIRKVGNTIKNSIFAELTKVIGEWNLKQYFKINNTDFTITAPNDYQIICRGLDDAEKIKSITVKKGIITDIWVEEATELIEEDYMQLYLRLRGKSDVKKQIVFTFNPISNLHWIKTKLFDLKDDNTDILKTTYLDNRFLTEEDKKRIQDLKNRDLIYYNIYALGEWGVLGNLIFNNWQVQDLTELKDKFNHYYYGLDFGFTNDPTAIVKVALKDDRIYILDEIYQKGLENNQIAKLLQEFSGGSYVYCDSSEPKSIKELRNYNINALAVSKGKDSIMHGIQWLRQYKIIVNSCCKNVINELQCYKYREDKDGNVLNEPVDMFNHCLDALRYATESLMRYNLIKAPYVSASRLGL